MLICLDETLVTSLAANPSHQNVVAIAVDAVADAVRQGNHILFGSVAVIDALVSQQLVLGPRTLEILRRARSKSILRDELFQHLTWYVRLVDETHISESVTIDVNRTEVRLSSRTLAQSTSLVAPTRFISENGNDAIFYIKLIESYSRAEARYRPAFSSVKLRYQNAPGGGNTTADLYALEKQHKSAFCLAVVDSDRRFPGGACGQTAKRVLDQDAPPHLPSWNCKSHVVDARTVENIFPKSTLTKCAERIDPQVGLYAQNAVDLHFNQPQWPYIPLKRGIKCYEVTQADGISQFWQAALNIPQCPRNHQRCERREDCITYVVPPLSDRLLEEACSPDVHVEICLQEDNAILGTVERISVTLFSAFCGDEIMVGQ